MARQRPQAGPAAHGRLLARPAQPGSEAVPGVHSLGIVAQRDAFLYVPPTYRADQPAPLVLVLHGAGGDAQRSLGYLQALADQHTVLLLSPASRGRTWDVILGGYGPDVAVIDRALAQVFSHYTVDAQYLAIGGFSDGASYALSLGLTNGDLWSHVLAFSPGFMAPAAQHGTPRVFISHGTQDTVLPIDRCSRRIVPQLQQAGYDVVYREFDGPHTVPPAIAREVVAWFVTAERTPLVSSE